MSLRDCIVDGHASGAGVQLHRAAAISLVACPVGSPEKRPHPGQQLFHMKRFGDVIVCARIEALHLVAPAVAGGQDHDRHLAALPPPGVEHRDAVHVGQPEIEDRRVVRLGFAKELSLLAVERPIDRIPRRSKALTILLVQNLVVFNNEEAHAWIFLMNRSGDEIVAKTPDYTRQRNIPARGLAGARV